MTGRRVVVAGASGLIGSGLCASLAARGDEVVRLVRRDSSSDDRTSVFEWIPRSGRLDPAALKGADAVVVLNGVPIGDKRWSDERKELILASRTDAVGTVARTIATMVEPPPVLVAASAIGIYGDRGDEVLDESSSRGTGFFSDVCTAWEQAAQTASEAGVRVVNVRTGIVLTARAENHLYGVDDLEDTVARLIAYRAAGADVVYAPGPRDPTVIRTVVEEVRAPINVLLRPRGPSPTELAELGVRRASTGGALAHRAYRSMEDAAHDLIDRADDAPAD